MTDEQVRCSVTEGFIKNEENWWYQSHVMKILLDWRKMGSTERWIFFTLNSHWKGTLIVWFLESLVAESKIFGLLDCERSLARFFFNFAILESEFLRVTFFNLLTANLAQSLRFHGLVLWSLWARLIDCERKWAVRNIFQLQEFLNRLWKAVEERKTFQLSGLVILESGLPREINFNLLTAEGVRGKDIFAKRKVCDDLINGLPRVFSEKLERSC